MHTRQQCPKDGLPRQPKGGGDSNVAHAADWRKLMVHLLCAGACFQDPVHRLKARGRLRALDLAPSLGSLAPASLAAGRAPLCSGRLCTASVSAACCSCCMPTPCACMCSPSSCGCCSSASPADPCLTFPFRSAAATALLAASAAAGGMALVAEALSSLDPPWEPFVAAASTCQPLQPQRWSETLMLSFV